MDLNTLERYIMAEWVFVPVMIVVMLCAFGVGMLMGFVWGAL
jgi:hypothetical protein